MPVRELQGFFASYNFNAFSVVNDAAILLGIVTKLDMLRIFRHHRARLRPSLSELWADHVEDIMRRRVVYRGAARSAHVAAARTSWSAS
jgi:CBS-domain-containing membrane protein